MCCFISGILSTLQFYTASPERGSGERNTVKVSSTGVLLVTWTGARLRSYFQCSPSSVEHAAMLLTVWVCLAAEQTDEFYDQIVLVDFTATVPLPSIRPHLSYDDCLEDKREDYQNCSMLYCVTHCARSYAQLIWAVLTNKLLNISFVQWCI